MIAYALRRFSYLSSILFVLLGNAWGSAPHYAENQQDYNSYLVKYKNWAENGLTYIENQTFPHQVEFVVTETDQSRNHHTTILTRCYYQKNGQKQIVHEDNCLFRHTVATQQISPQEHLYLDIDKGLYRPKIQMVEYIRPDFSLLGLPELKYNVQQPIFAGQAVNACALVVQQEGEIVQTPLLKFYKIESETQQTSPFLYSDGVHFHLTDAFEATCCHLISGKSFTISYVVPTLHQLSIKPETRLQITKNGQTTDTPFSSALKRGLYRKINQNSWIKLDKDLTPTEPNKSYIIKHPDGSWIHEVRTSLITNTNTQVLQTLKNTAFFQDISGLHFDGRTFIADEQSLLCELLTQMPVLTHLDLSLVNQAVDYNAVVPTLLALPSLSILNVTNCSLTLNNLLRLQNQNVSYYFGAVDGFPYKHSGFSGPEGTHRWTDGKQASFEVPVVQHERRLKKISLINTACLVSPQHSQLITVFLNDTQFGQYTYYTPHNSHTIEIQIPDNCDRANITFEMPNAISPTALGTNTDPRILGLSINQIQLWYPLTVINNK